METVTDKIDRHKAMAKILLSKNIQAFIKDSNQNIYFAEIILIDDDSLSIECFGPRQRTGQEFTLYWPQILQVEAYEGKKGREIKDVN